MKYFKLNRRLTCKVWSYERTISKLGRRDCFCAFCVAAFDPSSVCAPIKSEMRVAHRTDASSVASFCNRSPAGERSCGSFQSPVTWSGGSATFEAQDWAGRPRIERTVSDRTRV